MSSTVSLPVAAMRVEAASRAARTSKAGMPCGTGIPCFLKMSFAWYSWSFMALHPMRGTPGLRGRTYNIHKAGHRQRD